MPSLIEPANLQTLLDVEVALARAEADVGVIPASCVPDIQAAARAELYDPIALAQDADRAGNIVIPLVRQLTTLVAARDPMSARYVHYGATSQDILDTAAVIQVRAVGETLDRTLTRAMTNAAALARQYATTPMPGRTWLQHASPITFGLKAAGWLDMMGRCRARLRDTVARALVVQLGGASGTLAALGDAGLRVAEAFARELTMTVPPMPWHTHRDRLADVAAALGIMCGAFGKIGRDLTLLAQTDVLEVFDQPVPGLGTSSSMPQKQNPVRAVAAVAAAVRAPGLVSTMLAAMLQEHERAAGGWQAEWSTLPELAEIAVESSEAIASALETLCIDVKKMHDDLEVRGGSAMAEALAVALAARVGRTEAMTLVERLCRTAVREGRSLRDVAAADPDVSRWLSWNDLDRVVAPGNFLGSAGSFVERVLREWNM